jgi:hypothetical protein
MLLVERLRSSCLSPLFRPDGYHPTAPLQPTHLAHLTHPPPTLLKPVHLAFARVLHGSHHLKHAVANARAEVEHLEPTTATVVVGSLVLQAFFFLRVLFNACTIAFVVFAASFDTSAATSSSATTATTSTAAADSNNNKLTQGREVPLCEIHDMNKVSNAVVFCLGKEDTNGMTTKQEKKQLREKRAHTARRPQINTSNRAPLDQYQQENISTSRQKASRNTS